MQPALDRNQPADEFSELCRKYPLSDHWQPPELFQEAAKVGPLTTSDRIGHSTFGSAAELRSAAGRRGGASIGVVARSYFELMERAATVESIDRSPSAVAVYDAGRHPFSLLPRSVVHPPDEHPNVRRHAKSNGVAAHVDWLDACRSAARELVERDRVLRSWYGASTPVELGLGFTPHPVGAELGDAYEFSAFGFGHVDIELSCGRPRERVEVVGVFGFPRVPHAPMLFGFGTADCVACALERAWGECTQRLGFLWGESIPSELPEMGPTAAHHQEYYLYAPHHDRLRRWLDGEHRRHAGILRSVRCDEPEIVFADLTPSALSGRLVVVKALCAETVPLVFGIGHPWLVDRPGATLAVHPVA
jgi:hypothetical protein